MANQGKETWRNATQGYVVLAKLDRRGERADEVVAGGRTVLISPEERSLNSYPVGAATEALDVFKNGMMVPVRLIDDTEDKAEIESNPNLKSEGELRDLFTLHWKKFEAEVAQITNVVTLNRLKEIAQEGDATVRQVNVIESRVAEVDPASHVVDVTMQSYGSLVSPVKGEAL